MKQFKQLASGVVTNRRVVMGASLTVTGLVSILIGMSLASCDSIGRSSTADSSGNTPIRGGAATPDDGGVGGVRAVVGITGEPEMRVRIAEAVPTAKISGAEGFWIVPVATLGTSAVVQNSKSQMIRGPLEVTLAADAWVVRDGTDKIHRYPIKDPGKVGLRDLEIEGVEAPGSGTAAATISLNNTPYSGHFRLTLPSGTAPLTPPAGGPPVLGTPQAPRGPAGTFDVVEYVPLETYLPGVVAKELYKDWPLNAFKVQAVCARSYAIHERQRSTNAGRKFDVEASQRDQAYAGATALPVALDAVRQTRGIVLTNGSNVLRSYYSSTCGGRAASAADTWPTWKGFEFNLAAPIQGHEREFACDKSPLFRWQVERPKDELVRRLAVYGERNNYAIRAIRDLAKVEVTRVNKTGRPAEFKIIEPGGKWYTLKAEEFRLACNTEDPATRLPAITRQTRVSSSDVEVQVQGSNVLIAGRGFGHGVGMCQYCTKAMADRGDPWMVALLKFYPGAKAVRAY